MEKAIGRDGAFVAVAVVLVAVVVWKIREHRAGSVRRVTESDGD